MKESSDDMIAEVIIRSDEEKEKKLTNWKLKTVICKIQLKR